jgi:tetratricopeptide (TPR) repeat protein
MDLSEFDIDFLSQRLSDNPQSPLFARLADLYLSKNQSSEALKLCETGVQAYSSYATGYVVLGKCYLALNENSKAKLAFTQAMHLSPFNQVARKLLSEIVSAADESPESAVGESSAASSPSTDAPPEQQIAASAIEESIVAPPSVQVPEPVDEESSLPTAIEEPVQEIIQPEQIPTVEATVENNVAAPVIEERVPEIIEPAAIQTSESAPLMSLDDYVQFHSANLAADKAISLDEYLGNVQPANVPAPVTELDTLASKLENAERLVPQEPEEEASPKESVPSDSLVITPTLAEIYATQGEYGAAIQAYEILILSKPHERDRFEKRIKELQAKLYDGG